VRDAATVDPREVGTDGRVVLSGLKNGSVHLHDLRTAVRVRLVKSAGRRRVDSAQIGELAAEGAAARAATALCTTGTGAAVGNEYGVVTTFDFRNLEQV